MDISPDKLSIEARYKLLTGSVIPRPIAMISTISRLGIFNVAPFSYFTIVGHSPMALSFAVAGPKPGGTPKDTLRNVALSGQGGTGEFVASIATEDYLSAVAQSATPLGDEESEFDFTGLTPVASELIKAPRIQQATIAFECKTLDVVAVGRSWLVIGEVIYIHIDDKLIDDRYRIDYEQLRAIGRMAGSRYARTSDTFVLDDEPFFPGNPKETSL